MNQTLRKVLPRGQSDTIMYGDSVAARYALADGVQKAFGYMMIQSHTNLLVKLDSLTMTSYVKIS
jgi:hypothetical protein